MLNLSEMFLVFYDDTAKRKTESIFLFGAVCTKEMMTRDILNTEFKIQSLFLIVMKLQRVYTQGEYVFSAVGREKAVCTEQLIQASSENFIHLMSCLHSVQML